MPEAYKFTGTQTLGYFAYGDVSTGRMLVADPGESYQIRACEEGLAVPPPDGRWVTADAPPSPPPVPSFTAPKQPVTVPASTEGSEA